MAVAHATDTSTDQRTNVRSVPAVVLHVTMQRAKRKRYVFCIYQMIDELLSFIFFIVVGIY